MVHLAESVKPISFVEATLSYLVESGEKPVTYPSIAGVSEEHRTGRYEDRKVMIRDARAVQDPFALDRHGFLLVRHDTAVVDFYDDAQIREIYEAEVARLVREATGAPRAVVFDHTRRVDSATLRAEKTAREPARIIHNDYTDRSGPQRVRDLLPTEAESLLARRFAIVNVWRSIAGPVETAPLALCDARSVAPADLVPAERRAKHRVGEVFQVTYNPDHRWFYFPAMRRDEALLIKTYDSARDGRSRFSVHTAFNDPTSPQGAAPRESIESRAFVFF